jgi:hypothetical protein
MCRIVCATVLALTLCGLPARVRAADSSDAPEDGKVYIIRNVLSGKRLAIAGGATRPNTLLVQDDSKQTRVLWRLERTKKRHFRIVNTKSNLSLDVPGLSKDAGVQIQQWITKPDHPDFPNQEWEFIKIGQSYAIRSTFSKMVLDVKDASTDNGAAVIQFPLNAKGDRGNQLWILTQVKR